MDSAGTVCAVPDEGKIDDIADNCAAIDTFDPFADVDVNGVETVGVEKPHGAVDDVEGTEDVKVTVPDRAVHGKGKRTAPARLYSDGED